MAHTANITAEAHRIIATPAGRIAGCTWIATKAEWLEAAQRALDGDTDDLELYLDMEAAEVWQMSDWRQEQWFTARASESYIPQVAA